jgi:Zn-finger nucleic acid-binding protein
MESIVVDGVEVDRCAGCEGLWFDAGELDWLAQDEVAEAIDVGEVRALNHVTEIDCPRCGKPMKHVADRHKPDVRYEVCIGCEGAFLDAGEFRDLARLSLAELFRGLIRRRRR